MYHHHYTVPETSFEDERYTIAQKLGVEYVPERVYDFNTQEMYMKYPVLKQYGDEIHRLVHKVFSEKDTLTLPLRIDTNHLTDDQEAWFLTYLLGAVIQQLDFDTIPQTELLPEHHLLINQYMRELFAIDVQVSLTSLPNSQKVQFQFTRL